MPTPMTINCPSCQVKLKLKDDSKLGKNIACPKCQNPFVLEKPKDEFEELTEFTDEDDDFDAPPLPPKTKKSPAKSKKRVTGGKSSGIGSVDEMTRDELRDELDDGARFVIYQYCISIGIMTFLRSSKIHFIPAGSSSFFPGLGYTFLTLVMGWWGIPCGPIYTIMALVTNLGGGKDVTNEVVGSLS